MNMSRNLKVLFGAFALTVAAASARADIAEEPLLNPDDPTDVWGKKITGLGDNGDETALVFTKTGETMGWTLPDGVKSIWYLVVGGGGSGGSSYADGNSGGGGGGAGGMLEAQDVSISSLDISVSVGKGGDAVTATSNNNSSRPAGNTGGNSSLTFDGVVITAHGGGGGGGCGSKAGKKGGSGGGAYANNTVGACYEGEGNVGGQGTGSTCGGGGGGGAGGPGGGTGTASGGVGGSGKTSAIGGGYVALVKVGDEDGNDYYCAGGGGGCGGTKTSYYGGAGGVGGGGKGNAYSGSADTTSDSGSNYGCGGGGSQGAQWKKHTSGAGYQGVIIVRYRVLAANEVEVPTIEGKTYNGELQKADIADGDGYYVAANEGGVNAGDYVVTVTPSNGYQWVGGSRSSVNLTFTISKAENAWMTEPSLSETAWGLSDDPATVNAGAALSETAVLVTYDEGATEMPLTVGDHTAVFTVEESQNYTGIEKTIGYTISKNTNAWMTEPGLTKPTWSFDEEPGAVIDGEARYGDVDVIYDDDQSLVELPKTMGEHTVKFLVAETDTYTGLEKVVNYTVTKKQHKWTVSPNVPATVNIEDGVNFPMPAAEQGVTVLAYYDDDPSKTELTELSVGESHSVTYEIAGNDDWDAVKEAFPFTVTYKPIVDPEDPTNEYGYRVPGLGENKDEIALVFTKTGETLKWIPDLDYANVQFLVVGGGGGGGGFTGGGGGGGGGVVTGSINQVSKQIPVLIVVGAGGKGGASSGVAGQNGGASSVSVVDAVLVKAYGGDRGYGKKTDKTASGIGSGGGGSCGFVGNDNAFGGIFDESCVTAVAYGCAGGSGESGGSYAGAGGGGALASGVAPSSDSIAGKGGEGLTSGIFGSDDVFGSGGGGGMGKNGTVGQGGANAGRGVNSNQSSSGRDGKANRGGGGGGGGGNADSWHGGQGGSGIVVLRYVKPAGVAPVPTLASKTYTGVTQTADVPVDPGYIVTSNEGGIDVGNYDVVLTLNDGYHWDGGSTEPTNLTFAITRAQNEWTVVPLIKPATWLTTDEPGVLTNGVTKFGGVSATIAKDGGAAVEFDGTLPAAAGQYVITYTVETSDNWFDPEVKEKSVAFEIVSGDVVPPFKVTKEGEITPVVGEGQVDLSVGYAVHCDVESDKTVDIYAYIAEDGADTTNEVKIAEGVTLDAVGTGTVPDLKPGVTYWVALGGRGGETVAPMTEFTTVTMTGPATDLTASATFTNDPKEFAITGSVTPGLGTTTVTVRWSLNSDALDQSQPFTFAYGDAGAFTQKVAYAELTDRLTWDVAVSNSYTSTTYGERTWDASLPATTADRSDQSDVTYTWKGADGSWFDPSNWTSSRTPCFGYPDNPQHAIAYFKSSRAVDLGGKTVKLMKDGLQFEADDDNYVTISNGTLTLSGTSDRTFGAKNTKIVFKDITFDGTQLSPVNGAVVIFDGDCNLTGRMRPQENNVRLFVQNGAMTVDSFLTGGGDNRLSIDNATLTVKGTHNSSWTPATYAMSFVNGADRQPRLVLTDKTTGWRFGQEELCIAIPEKPYADAYIQAVKHFNGNEKPKFKIDVTNWKKGKKVPLVKFTSTSEQTTFANLSKTVVATVVKDGKTVDVTAARNAQLIWEGETNTLYYKQDSQGGFALIVK